MTLRQNANVFLSFLDPGLAVITTTVCKSADKRFRASTLDFNKKHAHELHGAPGDEDEKV